MIEVMSNCLSLEQEFPPKPTFPDELWNECIEQKDFMPILFEWYKYTGVVCNIVASISRHSPAVREMPPLHFAVLTGLLNRCSRLMLSNIRLSVMNKYGETTRLLDRCIIESAVIVQWLCQKDSDECFQRYLADGVKSDLSLKDQIQQNIAERKGTTFVIENRMLSSIERCISSTELTEDQIHKTKKLPDMWSMCRDLTLPPEFYIGFQRMGSHEVHGTWSSLRNHYLRQDESGEYLLRDHDVPPHETQFTVIPLIVMETLESFFQYIVPDASDSKPVMSILSDARIEIGELTRTIMSEDFEIE